MKAVKVSFKDPDFAYALQGAGMPEKVADKLQKRAEFGEYWTLKLTFDPETGDFTGKVIRG